MTKYVEIELDVIKLASEDIIVTSNVIEKDEEDDFFPDVW